MSLIKARPLQVLLKGDQIGSFTSNISIPCPLVFMRRLEKFENDWSLRQESWNFSFPFMEEIECCSFWSPNQGIQKTHFGD